jgi:ATP/maltotriose-dependent transcriptional regulator MalT
MVLNSAPISSNNHSNLPLTTLLEDAEIGLAVVEGDRHAVYLNGSARKLLGCESQSGALPDWVQNALAPLVERLWQSGSHAVERWIRADLALRVHARPLDRVRNLAALEITVAHATPTGTVAECLASSLALSMPDARLLAFIWRGLSNEDIAQTLNVRLGTVKSRLFRLYQRLGVNKRSAAVLRAAEVLKDANPSAEA